MCQLRPSRFAVAIGMAVLIMAACSGVDDPVAEDVPVEASPAATAAAKDASQKSTPTPTSTPSPTPTPMPSPTPTPSPTPSPTPTPTPTPTPDPRQVRCAGLDERGAVLGEGVEEVLDGMTGGWGLALVDLECDTTITVRPDHIQYTASAGKIVVVISVLRAVQDGLLDFESIRPHIEIILSISLDSSANYINDLVTVKQIQSVLHRANVSEASEYEHDWRYAHMTAPDMARVWVSLVRGEQLDEEWTAYLLDLATRPLLGVGFWPFPAEFGVEGYTYGQKAGYWTSPVPVGYRIAAGYARPEDGSSPGYIFAFLIQVIGEDWGNNWQRPLFPLVRDFMVAEMEQR